MAFQDGLRHFAKTLERVRKEADTDGENAPGKISLALESEIFFDIDPPGSIYHAEVVSARILRDGEAFKLDLTQGRGSAVCRRTTGVYLDGDERYVAVEVVWRFVVQSKTR